MDFRLCIILGFLFLAKIALSETCQAAYLTCGGKDYKGSTCCVEGYTCFRINYNHSQCIPTEHAAKRGTYSYNDFNPIEEEEEPVNNASSGALIRNNMFWKDTSGKNIYSQGGGVYKFGDTYYWYGVHYKGAESYANNPTKRNSDTSFVSVTCYSSKDLVTWKFENDILTPRTPNFGNASWLGRLGVAYCKNTRRYVLVTQYNDSILFASSDTPTGNFKIERVQDYITNMGSDMGTGDQTIFIDDDGSAYIICSNKHGRGMQYVSKLRDSDFLYAEPAKLVARGYGREGNALFKYKNKYYFCASDLHGWNASHSYYMVADNIFGPYSDWKVMEGSDEDFSFVTQTGFFYTIKGSKEETVIFCGDRWSDFAGNGLGYNQWVPLTVNGDKVKFNSLSEWYVNSETGEWSIGEGNNYCLNPSFEADRVQQNTLAGWKSYGTGTKNKSGGHTGNFCAEHWANSAYEASFTQDLTLPNGTYNLKAWVKSSGGQKTANIHVKKFGGSEMNVSINKKIDQWTQVSINNIKVTTGQIQIGIYSNANAGNYINVDDITLTH
ncbi:Arabinanase/levansucrase/invertase [Anaeromyces robustus]|jgi:hypothetical protein|uniref:Arabinanase/levansucrase/invertase n=1 Tax=Anaeromyces robustus TaxID=1754192 RepID=A0A1Y1X541_9FUNG|nr:Arabinanase/levansucrase/invertase [Anaeromyces robustus]|eukprot:ORX80476.1 Arabinanase/levansucrase/invertase [Anaeromyces robustus]